MKVLPSELGKSLSHLVSPFKNTRGGQELVPESVFSGEDLYVGYPRREKGHVFSSTISAHQVLLTPYPFRCDYFSSVCVGLWVGESRGEFEDRLTHFSSLA